MKKYKIKTKSSAKKRFKVTKSGKVLRRQAGNRHLLEHESRKNKKRRGSDCSVAKSDMKKVQLMMPGLGA